MALSIPLGVLNALANLSMWVITSICALVSERIYRRVSSRQLMRTGRTRSTDSSEISLATWLFSNRKRHVPSWWVIILLLLNVSLLPLEILFEAGIDQHMRCQPRSLTNSSGVCAEPWAGHSEIGIAATALLTQRFHWADEHWDFVLVGSKKTFGSSEVRRYSQLLNYDRSFVVENCHVDTAMCRSNCGAMTVLKSDGPFDTIISNWSGISRRSGRKWKGDVTWDQSTGMAFIFWENGSVPDPKRRLFNSSIISVKGVEAVLSDENEKRVLARETNPWALTLDKERTREYSIHCSTDGLTPWDLVRAVSLYRTMQMEQPGLQRHGVNSRIDKVPPMNSSDVVKAAFAMKADDWSRSCTGDIDVYSTCGGFMAPYILPFVALASCIILGWLFIYCTVEKGFFSAPVDTRTWREYAVKAMKAYKSGSLRLPSERFSMNGSDNGDANIGERENDAERNDENDTVFEVDMLDWTHTSRSRRDTSVIFEYET